MEFLPNASHQAFPGMINGGIIGTLLDCHGNWTAAVALMDNHGLEEPPCTVTASYSVKLRRPTPHGEKLVITSQINEIDGDKVKVDLLLEVGGKICASGDGLFVAVKKVTQHIIGGIKLMVKPNEGQRLKLENLRDIVVGIMMDMSVWQQHEIDPLLDIKLGLLRRNATQRHGVTKWKRGITD